MKQLFKCVYKRLHVYYSYPHKSVQAQWKREKYKNNITTQRTKKQREAGIKMKKKIIERKTRKNEKKKGIIM